MTGERRVEKGTLLAAAAVASVALLPFVRGLAAGATFYFRDLGRHFLPLRAFVVEGLRSGDVRFWNPYVHEGEPLAVPPISYPLDLLQVLIPNEVGFSLLLALHVPLAALAFLALCRGLGVSRTAGAGGALVYALGGFTLSCLNLYVLLQAAAWAPLVVLSLVRAAEGPARRVAAAGLVSAIALSTLGFEIVAQAFVVAGVLAARRVPRTGWLRIAAGLALGLGLAAPTLLWSTDLLAGSARAQGLSTKESLGFSLHPISLLQVVVGGLFGDLADFTNRYWGGRFNDGFPYFMSLYLGAAALALAGVGAGFGTIGRRRLAWLAALGIAASLGRWVRLDVALEALPLLRSLRFPVKAFFTVHFAASLLVAAGLGALERGDDPRTWRWLQWAGLTLGSALCLAPALPWLFPGSTARFFEWLFPPHYAGMGEWSAHLLTDAAVGGLSALVLGLVAAFVCHRRLAPRMAAVAALVVVAADVLRAGAALNPMASPARLRPSREASELAGMIRSTEGRLFTCEAGFSRALFDVFDSIKTDRDLWMVNAYSETLTPAHNVALRVPTAYSRDLTMAVPTERVFASRDDVACADVASILDRLRAAGVSHLVSFRPLDVPGLRLVAAAAPPRIAPLRIHLHVLEARLPLRAVASMVRPAASRAEAEALARRAGFQAAGGVAVEGSLAVDGVRGEVRSRLEAPDRIELDVEADGPTVVVVRDGYAAGWSATVDGAEAPLLRADGRHRAVPVPAGRSRVVLSYRPPSLAKGLWIGFAALGLTLATLVRRGRP
jgi:hypothetical protein